MPRLLTRIVALVVVACLVFDPASSAVASVRMEQPLLLPLSPAFTLQAIPAPDRQVPHGFTALPTAAQFRFTQRHYAEAQVSENRFALTVTGALLVIGASLALAASVWDTQSLWPSLSLLAIPLAAALMAAIIQPIKFPKVNPWQVATHVQDRKRGIGTIVSHSGREASVEFPAVTRTVPKVKGKAPVEDPERGAGRVVSQTEETVTVEFPPVTVTLLKKAIQPVFTLFELGVILDVNAYSILDPAMMQGWFSPDIPRDPADQEYVFPESLDRLRERFVLLYDPADVLDVDGVAKAMRKLPVRVYDLIRTGRLKPIQTIWTGDARGTPFFPRRDLQKMLEDFAPEEVENAYRLDVLARKLGRPERVVGRAIAEGRIKLRAIGPSANRHYIATPRELAKYKAALKPAPRPRDESPLRYPKDLVMDQYDLANELNFAGATSVSNLVSTGEIEPIQSVFKGAASAKHYFLRSKLEDYKREFAPQLLEHTYKMQALAEALDLPVDSLSELLKDGIIQPREVLGVVLKPFFVVPPEDMETFKAIVHPEKRRIAFDALADELKTNPQFIAEVTQLLRIPVQVEFQQKRTLRYVDIAYRDAIAAHVPPPAPKDMLPATYVERRLGLTLGRLKGLPSDDQRPHGLTGIVFHYYDEKNLPDPKKPREVSRWLEDLEIKASRIRTARDAGAPAQDPEGYVSAYEAARQIGVHPQALTRRFWSYLIGLIATKGLRRASKQFHVPEKALARTPSSYDGARTQLKPDKLFLRGDRLGFLVKLSNLKQIRDEFVTSVPDVVPVSEADIVRYREGLGQRAQEAREKKFTQEQVQARTRWPPGSVSKLENARRSPRMDRLRKYARAIEHPLIALVDPTPDPVGINDPSGQQILENLNRLILEKGFTPISLSLAMGYTTKYVESFLSAVKRDGYRIDRLYRLVQALDVSWAEVFYGHLHNRNLKKPSPPVKLRLAWPTMVMALGLWARLSGSGFVDHLQTALGNSHESSVELSGYLIAAVGFGLLGYAVWRWVGAVAGRASKPKPQLPMESLWENLPKRIALLSMPGAGKETNGTRLARDLGMSGEPAPDFAALLVPWLIPQRRTLPKTRIPGLTSAA